jgi:hypothetical protein
MDELRTSLASPVWWVSVVIAGLLVNLAAAYVKPTLDHWIGRWSSSYRARTAAQAQARAEQIAKLKTDAEERLMLRLASIDRFLRGLFVTLTAIFIEISGLFQEPERKTLTYLWAVAVLAAGMLFLEQAARRIRLYNAATGKKEMV